MTATRRRSTDQLVQAVGTAGIAWGSLILTAGVPIWQRVAGAAPTTVDAVALRLLGARHVATGTVQVLWPRHLQRLEVAVDVIHAATMVGLAAVDPPRRRPALVTAAAAVAGAGALVASRARAAGRAADS